MNFKSQVIEFINKIPKGKVVSYGQVAAACGHPSAARQVGQILKLSDIRNFNTPWWRVINNKGEISIRGNWTATKEQQRDLLVRDGIKIEKDFKIQIEKYRWKK